MPGISTSVYKGKTILVVNYKGCSDEREMIGLFSKVVDKIKEYKQGILVLINFRGAFQTPQFIENAKEFAKLTQPFVIKRAIVGIENPNQLILLNMTNQLLGDKTIKPFKTLKEAKEWLVK